MVLDKLGGSLKNTLSKIAKAMFVDENLVNELVKDIQRALLQADVNVKLVLELSKNIKERALKERPPSGLSQKEYLINVVYEELVKFLGGEKNEIEVDKSNKPFQMMMVGLFGSGKTTTIAKLAKYYAKRGFKVAAIGLDVHRPAAPEQLKQNMDNVNMKSFIMPGEKDAMKIYKNFEEELKKYDIVLVDTAGRDALSDDLIKELEKLNKYIKPDERILVISADIGQAAQKQAQQFHDSCDVSKVIITKLDGTAKGGGALSACAVTDAPIAFIGVGEKADELESFNPKGFVGRLLGMGDLEALLEKAQDAISPEDAQDMGAKMLSGDFSLIDLYDQMQAMSKMGPLSKVMDLIPGMGKLNVPKDMIAGQEEKLHKWKFIMQSCTKKELEDPSIIDRNRIERIAKGAGVEPSEVRSLIKQYNQSKKMIKGMKGVENMDPNQLMKKFKGKVPKGFKL